MESILKKFFLLIILWFLHLSCAAPTLERRLIDPADFQGYSKDTLNSIKEASPYLKAHMKNGRVYIFHSWSTDSLGNLISGEGVLYGLLRDTITTGHFILGLDSIAIVESNIIKNSGAVTALTIFTGITAAITAICLTNPKACFGSCPTFYVSDGDSLRLMAEGFSSSISPSLEATDVDALCHAHYTGHEFSVEMRNEALETHVVRHVDLLAIPRRAGCRTFATTDNKFWESTKQIHPISARGNEGDCLQPLLELDGSERFSKADETFLGAKENIDLQFKVTPNRNYGLVIACRQTLLPTYLLYQTYAYMGNDVGHWFAEIERKNLQGRRDDAEKIVGGIESTVQQQDGSWKIIGEINEHGPLAVDTHLLPLSEQSDSILHIQLHMTKGAWRIDYVALAELSKTVEPIRVHPSSVHYFGKEDSTALLELLDSSRVLVTFPGDCYSLNYNIPDGYNDYEFFLESRGYYLEWIRKEWIVEENQSLLGEIIVSPQKALKRLAPEFKLVEPKMEDCFWRSRYAKP